MVFQKSRLKIVSVFALAFILVVGCVTALFSLESGLARTVMGALLGKTGEDISLSPYIESTVNMKYLGVDEDEESSLNGDENAPENKSSNLPKTIDGVWLKDQEGVAGFYFDTEGLPIHRLTVEFSEPLTEYVELDVGIQRNEGEDFDWSVSDTIYLNQGDTYALFRLSNADGAKKLCLSITSDAYAKFSIESISLDSNNRHIGDAFRSMPWVFIIAVSFAAAYLLTLLILRCVWKHPLIFTLDVVFLMALIIYRRFICENVSYLYTSWDGFSQYLPTYVSYARSLREMGYLPNWSFSIGFGSMLSYDVLLYPLNAIAMLIGALFGNGALEMSFVWMQIVKIELAALFMFLFLQEIKMERYTCTCISIAYAFCGIMILRGNWGFLADEVFLSVMLLWAVERYFRRGQWGWIPPVIYLLATCMGIFYIYLYALLLIVYATVRFIYVRGSLKGYFKYILKCGLLFLLGLLLWSVILIGFTWTLFQTTRFGDTVSYFSMSNIFDRATWDVLLTAIMRTFSTDILGIFDECTGYANYLEGPLFYCGLLCLFLIPQALKEANRRHRVLILVGLAAIFAYMVFPFITDLMCAFIRNEETGLRSYRISSEWICVLMMVIAAFGLNSALKKNRFSAETAIVTGIVLFAILIFTLSIIEEFGISAVTSVEMKVVFFLATWLVMVVYFRNTRGWKVAMLAAIVLEALIFSNITVSKSFETAFSYYRQMQMDDMGYYSSVGKAVDTLKAEDGGLYRVGGVRPETGGSRYCSSLYFDLFDSTYYTNIDNNNYAILKTLYPDAFDTLLGSKNSIGVADNPDVATLTGYKYYLCLKNKGEEEVPACYEYLTTIDNVEIYVNPDAYSFGTTYDKCISSERFTRLSLEERQRVLLNCVVVDDPKSCDLPEISDWELKRMIDPPDESKDIHSAIDAQHASLEVAQWRPDYIQGSVEADKDCVMLFTIPNIKGWTVTVDGKEAEILPMDIGFFGIKLTKGNHDIELSYKVETFNFGLFASLAALVAYFALIFSDHKMHWFRASSEQNEKAMQKDKRSKVIDRDRLG